MKGGEMEMKNKNFKPTYPVGFKGNSLCGSKYTVIEYNGRKDITIKFECGYIKNTTSTHIKQNKVKYNPPTTLKGEIKESKFNGDRVTVLEEDGVKLLCRWESDGYEKWIEKSVFKEGILKHPLANKVSAGEIYPTRLYWNVTVKEVRSAKDIDVTFDDGTQVNVTKNNLFSGYIRHPYSNLVIGSYFKTNSGFMGKIIEYKDCKNVVVRWEDGTISEETASHINAGSIKPKTQRTVFNVGYVGYGKWVPPSFKLLSEGQEFIPPKIYRFWARMLDRLYNTKTLTKKQNKNYLYAVASDEFKCAQNFVEWAINQPYWDQPDAELDKDLLGNGLLYSEDTCCFLPRKINIFLADFYSKKVSDLPKGVNLIAPRTENSKQGYVARCHSGSERLYLGYFDTPEEAFLVYKETKEKVAKQLAEEYKDKISYKAYEALYNFTVD